MMKSILLKYKWWLLLAGINMLLLIISSFDQGRMVFLIWPVLVGVNLVSAIVGFIIKSWEFGLLAIFLLVVTPLLLVVVFLISNPLLTR